MLQLSQHPMFNGNYFQCVIPSPSESGLLSMRDFVEAENTLSCERRINVDVANTQSLMETIPYFQLDIPPRFESGCLSMREILWRLRIPSLENL